MMLRNRDLNVQPKNGERQQKVSTTAAVKRQAAHLINTKEDPKGSKDEPKPKRICKSSTNILPEFSKALCLDSNKKTSSSAADIRESKESSEDQLEVQQTLFDFDCEQAKELTAVSEYVMDIFTYYKYRECFFRVSDYTKKQPQITVSIRAELVNWLVDLQETFELNHETLYLSVKLFDLFLDRAHTNVQRNELQLIASAAVFIAAKFDERAPPLIDDFIYMTEDTFTRDQMTMMERELLKVINFDLGAPLSYRFLRRYARVSKTDMATLTLARYILELSLMSLRFCRKSESLIAGASLMLARRIREFPIEWDPVMKNLSGYTLAEVEPLMWSLNRMLAHRETQFGQLDNVFKKYSHEIFFEVANHKPLVHHQAYANKLSAELSD